MNGILRYFFAVLASTAALNGLEKVPPAEQLSLKQLAIKTIIKRRIPVRDAELPVELRQELKQEMLDGREIDFIAILNKIPVPRKKVTSLRPIESIVSMSPNGKKLLAHHSEKLTFSVWDADTGTMLCEIPRHCDCLSAPLHSFSYEGTDLAFLTHCHKKKQDMLEVFKPDCGDMQTMVFTDFSAEAIALSADGSVLVCAGGCGVPLRVYKRPAHTADFVLVNMFGAGYIIALSQDNKKLAALTHGYLTVYDLDTTKALYQAQKSDTPNLQFCPSTGDVLIATHASTSGQENTENINDGIFVHIPVPAQTFLPSVSSSSSGCKITSLVNGVPRFTYLIDGKAERYLELAISDDNKFNLIQLHDDDTAVTACTDHDVYQYDVKQLSQVESRFAKSLDDMAVDDVPVALALLQMSVADFKKRASQPALRMDETRVDKEIRELVFPGSSTMDYQQSLLQRIQLPLVGVAGFFLALCAVCN